MARKVLLQREVALSPKGVKLKPPLKWAGGKRWLLPVVQRIYKEFSAYRLVEPFVGGMAITLGILPDRALLNDINLHLINFYRHLQRGLVITFPMYNDRNYYYKARERFNQLIRDGKYTGKEAAELFYYLNRTGFNGLCRFNKKGEFNVPFGSYKKITYTLDFRAYALALANYTFVSGDFRNLNYHHTDFIYADPPYDVEFTEYSPGGFSFNDQRDLAEQLAQHPGPVLISNQATARIVNLYKDLGFSIWYLTAPRRISSNGDRTPTIEILAAKNIDTAMLKALPMLGASRDLTEADHAH